MGQEDDQMRVAVIAIAIVGLLSAVVGTAQETVYEPGGGVTLPRVVKEVRPQYPPGTMETGIQGTVRLRCVVQRDGRPGEVTVSDSLEPRLDEAAVEAMKQWEFEPGQRNGMPVAVRIAVEMTFTLK
jgi:protein TonB